MAAALKAAGLQPADIDYINLHGTATPSNDAAEGKAVAALFGDRYAVQFHQGRDRPHAGRGRRRSRRSSARWRCDMASCRAGSTPGSSTRAFPSSTCCEPASSCAARVLSNSFGFGGTNCSLVLGARRR